MVVTRIKPDEWALLRDMRLRALRDAPEAFGQTYENAAAEPESEWRSAARASSAGDRRAGVFARADEPAADGAPPAELGMVQARRPPPDDCLRFSTLVRAGGPRARVGRERLAGRA